MNKALDFIKELPLRKVIYEIANDFDDEELEEKLEKPQTIDIFNKLAASAKEQVQVTPVVTPVTPTLPQKAEITVKVVHDQPKPVEKPVSKKNNEPLSVETIRDPLTRRIVQVVETYEDGEVVSVKDGSKWITKNYRTKGAK